MKKRYIFIILSFFILFIYTTSIMQIKKTNYLIYGEKLKLKKLPGIEIVESKKQVQKVSQNQNYNNSKYDVMLFGNIKLKEISVTTYPKLKVIPTGNLIGLKLYTNGVLVIGTSEIKNINGNIEKPFLISDIKEGDIILELDNKKIESSTDIENITNLSKGNSLLLKYSRNNEICYTNIKPVEVENGKYKLGLWVRDSASGVGTMTFYEPETKKFVALGHGISDNDTDKLLDVGNGEIVNSKIVNITKGMQGVPGEIMGSILNETAIGSVIKNSNFGVFGILDNKVPTIAKYESGIDVELSENIELGDATILATAETGIVEEYNIEVTSINLENTDDNKNFQVKITDERLINKTGGIICGMSGCPVIQNNKLIGALTNVLVSDPTIGYGVFADTLVKEMVK